MTDATELIVMRHADSHAGAQRRFVNRIDDLGLTPGGRQRAHATGRRLATLGLSTISSSPLSRAAATAEIIARVVGRESKVVEDLREIDVGDLEGRSGSEAWNSYQDILRSWLLGEDRLCSYPDGESLHASCARFMAVLDDLSRMPGRHLVVTHGGIIRASLPSFAANLDGAFVLGNQLGHCQMVRFRAEGGGEMQCASWGEVILETGASAAGEGSRR